jgi:hypothetical protein
MTWGSLLRNRIEPFVEDFLPPKRNYINLIFQIYISSNFDTIALDQNISHLKAELSLDMQSCCIVAERLHCTNKRASFIHLKHPSITISMTSKHRFSKDTLNNSPIERAVIAKLSATDSCWVHS